MFSGFLNLNKPSGESSNKALFAVKKLLRDNKIDTKIGHLGTLDPLACGVLPVALGRATRLFDFMLDKKKVYRARFTFGKTSDSLDLGTPLVPFDGELVTKERIEAVLPSFLGKIIQIPPNYSAKNVNGVRAYDLARKGKEFTLKGKEVEVFSFRMIDQIELDCYEFLIECGSGTYIRSLARDLGAAVGSAAVMSYLCREQSGIFSLKNSCTKEDLFSSPNTLDQYVMPIETVLTELPKRTLTDKELCLLNGVAIQSDVAGLQRIYFQDDTLVGIGETDEKGLLKIKTRLL